MYNIKLTYQGLCCFSWTATRHWFTPKHRQKSYEWHNNETYRYSRTHLRYILCLFIQRSVNMSLHEKTCDSQNNHFKSTSHTEVQVGLQFLHWPEYRLRCGPIKIYVFEKCTSISSELTSHCFRMSFLFNLIFYYLSSQVWRNQTCNSNLSNVTQVPTSALRCCIEYWVSKKHLLYLVKLSRYQCHNMSFLFLIWVSLHSIASVLLEETG